MQIECDTFKIQACPTFVHKWRIEVYGALCIWWKKSILSVRQVAHTKFFHPQQQQSFAFFLEMSHELALCVIMFPNKFHYFCNSTDQISLNGFSAVANNRMRYCQSTSHVRHIYINSWQEMGKVKVRKTQERRKKIQLHYAVNAV